MNGDHDVASNEHVDRLQMDVRDRLTLLQVDGAHRQRDLFVVGLQNGFFTGELASMDGREIDRCCLGKRSSSSGRC